MLPRSSEPVFVISVAARLVEMHPQTLRKYEREGLVAPSRTTGNLRLYSDRDIERLRQVKYLVEERGLNLAGVQIALDMTQSLLDLRGRLSGMLDCQDAPKKIELVASIKHLDHSLAMLGYVPIRERA